MKISDEVRTAYATAQALKLQFTGYHETITLANFARDALAERMNLEHAATDNCDQCANAYHEKDCCEKETWDFPRWQQEADRMLRGVTDKHDAAKT